MKKVNIFYWIFTILLALLMLFSAYSGLSGDKGGTELMKHLGYPSYVLPFLSVAKVLGVLAILVPGWPRVREWAYAGFTFDLLGAGYSFVSVGDPMSSLIFIVVGLAVVAVSHWLNQKRQGQKLPV